MASGQGQSHCQLVVGILSGILSPLVVMLLVSSGASTLTPWQPPVLSPSPLPPTPSPFPFQRELRLLLRTSQPLAPEHCPHMLSHLLLSTPSDFFLPETDLWTHCPVSCVSSFTVSALFILGPPLLALICELTHTVLTHFTNPSLSCWWISLPSWSGYWLAIHMVCTSWFPCPPEHAKSGSLPPCPPVLPLPGHQWPLSF